MASCRAGLLSWGMVFICLRAWAGFGRRATMASCSLLKPDFILQFDERRPSREICFALIQMRVEIRTMKSSTFLHHNKARSCWISSECRVHDFLGPCNKSPKLLSCRSPQASCTMLSSVPSIAVPVVDQRPVKVGQSQVILLFVASPNGKRCTLLHLRYSSPRLLSTQSRYRVHFPCSKCQYEKATNLSY